MTDAPKFSGDDEESDDWTRAERTDLMSMADILAAQSMVRTADGEVVTAEYDLSGSVPRQDPAQRQFQSADIYIRLENTIYGPISQARLVELLEGGGLTGFESASSDLHTWTPLIYHPRMTLSSQIDPDATHRVLHGQTDLPSAGRPVLKVDLEALGEDPEQFIPAQKGTPLAAILVKPVKLSKNAKLGLPVLANLDEEKLEDVINRTGAGKPPAIPVVAVTAERPAITAEKPAHKPVAVTADKPAVPAPDEPRRRRGAETDEFPATLDRKAEPERLHPGIRRPPPGPMTLNCRPTL